MNVFIIGFGRMGQRHFEVVRQYHNANIIIFDLNKAGSEGPDGILIRDPKLIQIDLKEIKPSLLVISSWSH